MKGMISCRPARVLAVLAVIWLLPAAPARALIGVDWSASWPSGFHAKAVVALTGLNLKNLRTSAFTGTRSGQRPARTVIQAINQAAIPGDYAEAFDFRGKLSPDYTTDSLPETAQALMKLNLEDPQKSAFTGTLVDVGPALAVIQTIPYATMPGNYSVAFDFSNELSPDHSAGSFPDTAFASLYFTDDLANFSIENQVFDHALGLMDLDYQGAFNVNGEITPSPGMTDWFRFTAEFTSANQFAVLAFELDNLNGTFGDSTLRVENVALIPEPGVSALVGLGGLLLFALRKRRARSAISRSPPIRDFRAGAE